MMDEYKVKIRSNNKVVILEIKEWGKLKNWQRGRLIGTIIAKELQESGRVEVSVL